MDQHNFWYWLIEGMQGVMLSLVTLLPGHVPVGFAQFSYNFLVSAVTPILFYVGSFFNLCWFMLFLALLATSETARAAFAAYRTLAKMLPLP